MEPAEQTTNRSDAVEQLHQQLQISLHELVTSDDRKRASTVADKVRDFSLANTQLNSAKHLTRGFAPSGIGGNDEEENRVVPVCATLTVPEAARLLGVGRNLAYEIVARDGEIAGVPVIRVGRRLLIPLARLLEVLGLDDDSTQSEPTR
ncbi:MAG: helix-turn-helix domain-containing protein [Actinomycetota bacterium]|nr:helix-turn-helix domain-containing protein [Actinomycetota bacterium]